MSRYGTPFCSDEELLEELNKLGYDEVSPDVFSMMKDDLSELVEKEQENHPLSEYDYDNASPPPPPPNFLSSSDALIENRSKQEIGRKSDSNVSRKLKKKSQNKNSRMLHDSDSESSKWQTTANKLRGKSSSSASLDFENLYDTAADDILEENGDSENKLYDVDGMQANDIYLSRQNTISDINKNEDTKYGVSKSNQYEEDDFELGSKNDKYMSNPDVSVSKYRSNGLQDNRYTSSMGKPHNQAYVLSNTQKTANYNSMKTMKDAFKTFKLNKNTSESIESFRNYKGSDFNLNTSGSSTGSEIKTMKRKVLRRRNGRSIITEELVQIPDIFDTSYPESENLNSNKSFSSDDLSCKSNSSTGSIIAISPESIKSSPSTLSLTSTRSTSFRIPNSRKKKSDPVAMYGYYRKFWDNFKPPGENTHDRLRWAIRDKMLEYNI